MCIYGYVLVCMGVYMYVECIRLWVYMFVCVHNCVYVCICVFVCACGHVLVCVGVYQIFFSFTLPYFLIRQHLSLNIEFSNSTWLTCLPLSSGDPPVSVHWSVCATTPRFHVGARNPSSYPHACVTDTLPTKPSFKTPNDTLKHSKSGFSKDHREA